MTDPPPWPFVQQARSGRVPIYCSTCGRELDSGNRARARHPEQVRLTPRERGWLVVLLVVAQAAYPIIDTLWR